MTSLVDVDVEVLGELYLMTSTTFSMSCIFDELVFHQLMFIFLKFALLSKLSSVSDKALLGANYRKLSLMTWLSPTRLLNSWESMLMR